MRFVLVHKGGRGSGDFGHSGRPGLIGGSSGKTGKHERTDSMVRLIRGNTIDHVDDKRWMEIRSTFQHAVEGKLSKELVLKVGKPTKEGSWITQEFNVETRDGRGFAQTVLWYSRAFKSVKVQQQDMSLPSGLRGKGIGGDMIHALMSGYKALGVGNIPIHMNTNPSFWSHMNKKYPGMYQTKESLSVTKGGRGSGHRGHRGRKGERGGSTPGTGVQLSFLPEEKKPRKRETTESTETVEIDIPKGWTKFAHDTIVRSNPGGAKKVYIIKYSDNDYSVQRRYLGNALAREIRKLSPRYKTLSGAIARAERWLNREEI